MRAFLMLLLLLASAPGAPAQPDDLSLDDLLDVGEQWAQDNLDDDVLRLFQDVDREKVQQFLRNLQQELQGDSVVDLAQLRPVADAVMSLLEAHEESRPYAAWLKSRLDYLQMAEDVRAAAPPPKPEPGQPLKPAPNPAPEVQRELWRKQVAKLPAPRGAEQLAARLKPIFLAQKVPPELVWVAEVESSFNPGARSPAGAAGLYQLMPATAKQLGLALHPDERLDPEKNARAAAAYLKYLHGKFKDWPLTLAAYNAGEGRVQALLDRYQASSFDRIGRRLPAETQMYVPRNNATLLRREGVTLAQLKVPK
jgi:membrane-bound lytic murein transglycosylase D